MLELLVRNWWALGGRGLAALVFGLAALLLPGLTLDALVALFAAYAFTDGILAVIAALRPPGVERRATPRREALLLDGIAGLALGLAVALWPETTVLSFVVLAAGRALATGAFELVAAARLRRLGPAAGLLGAAGLASVALGGFLLLATAVGIATIVWAIGAHALAFGGLLATLALQLRARAGSRVVDRSGDVARAA